MTDNNHASDAGHSPGLILTSTITCPACAHRWTRTMPTDACQYIAVCERCHLELKPKPGDCCVYCSYGNVPCPPVQQERAESAPVASACPRAGGC